MIKITCTSLIFFLILCVGCVSCGNIFEDAKIQAEKQRVEKTLQRYEARDSFLFTSVSHRCYSYEIKDNRLLLFDSSGILIKNLPDAEYWTITRLPNRSK